MFWQRQLWVIVRAPDQPDSIIDSGYVFSFSCDGMYRVYMMNNGIYNGIANWSANTNIKAGENQANTMGIHAQGIHYNYSPMATWFLNSLILHFRVVYLGL